MYNDIKTIEGGQKRWLRKGDHNKKNLKPLIKSEFQIFYFPYACEIQISFFALKFIPK